MFFSQGKATYKGMNINKGIKTFMFDFINGVIR
jgi:hypothetical protein